MTIENLQNALINAEVFNEDEMKLFEAIKAALDDNLAVKMDEFLALSNKKDQVSERAGESLQIKTGVGFAKQVNGDDLNKAFAKFNTASLAFVKAKGDLTQAFRLALHEVLAHHVSRTIQDKDE